MLTYYTDWSMLNGRVDTSGEPGPGILTALGISYLFVSILWASPFSRS